MEYDIDPGVWIDRLLRQISSGYYEPTTPQRFPLAKSNGFSRTMTMPSIPDLTVYRAIVDHLYKRLRKHQRKHVYFDPAGLEAARLSLRKKAAKLAEEREVGYGPLRGSRFLAWLHFDQYRKRLVFDRLHHFIVVTDISNFFDTILHSRLAEALHRASAAPELVGLLSFLIERLSIRGGFMESPRIGLPVDEFDCSRKLAHIFLFAHDERIVAKVGEDAYVRWMDDQTIGTSSRAEALQLLSEIAASLARLHLTPNAGKSRILDLAAARRHFHLDLNAVFDRAEKMAANTATERKELRKSVAEAWQRAKKYEAEGEWEKVLKRVYRLAGKSRSRSLRRRALRDLLVHPRLAKRITDYMRCTGSAAELLEFSQKIWHHEEQIYPDVNLAVFECLLRAEADRNTGGKVRKLAVEALRGRLRFPGANLCASVAPLALLRFGDRRSLPLFKSRLQNPDSLPQTAVRSVAVVYASFGKDETSFVREAAARVLRGPLASLVRFTDRIASLADVPGRYKDRVSARYDAVANSRYLDMRSLVAVRLLRLNDSGSVWRWLGQRKDKLLGEPLSSYDKTLLRRLWP